MDQLNTLQARPGFALLHLGFRPFFLAAAAFSVVSVALWTLIYSFGWRLQPEMLSPIVWHAHEMVFGYTLAVAAGFLLTAVRNWTGIQTLHGRPLLGLLLLWLLARVLPFAGVDLALSAAAVADTLFLVCLAVAVGRPVVKSKRWQSLMAVVMVLILLVANTLFYLGVAGALPDGARLGLYSGLYAFLLLIFFIGRKVIPFFIERGVGYPVALSNSRVIDVLCVGLFAPFWLADLAAPHSVLTASLAGLLTVVHGRRLAGWYTHGIWQRPLLWVLYVGYGWLVVGFALKAVTLVFGLSSYLAVHAFALGGIGMLTVGMMARVSLGHTGRNIHEPPAPVPWIFGILFAAACVRVLLPLFLDGLYREWILVSQLLWMVAFGLFLYAYASMLVQPRVDGQYG